MIHKGETDTFAVVLVQWLLFLPLFLPLSPSSSRFSLLQYALSEAQEVSEPLILILASVFDDEHHLSN